MTIRVFIPHTLEFKVGRKRSWALARGKKDRVVIRVTSSQRATSEMVPVMQPRVVTNCAVKTLFSEGGPPSAIGPSKFCTSRKNMRQIASIRPILKILTRDTQRKVTSPALVCSQNCIKIAHKTPRTYIGLLQVEQLRPEEPSLKIRRAGIDC